MNCFRKHENEECQNVHCAVRDCSFRHPRICRYFRDYRNCKFGDYCKFKHEASENVNDQEITNIKRKLEELKCEIVTKDEEIKSKTLEIEMMNKKVSDKLLNMEEKLENMEIKLNKLTDENNLLKNVINITNKENEESVEVEENNIENKKEHKCNECDFIGKTESGLKVHKTAKHKETILKGYRKISKL